jgi:Nicotine adenine dinucleotide glycohydrolase (NADase)
MATEPAPMTCPDCAGPVWPKRDRLCPKCGYPLMFLQQDSEPEPEVVARAPGEQGDAPTITPAGPPATAGPSPGQLTCSRCGHHNPPDRVRCERCGQELAGQRRAAPLPPVPPAPPSPPRQFGWVGWLIAALAAVAVAAGAVVLVVALLDGGDDSDDQAGPTDSPPAPTETPEPSPEPVDPDDVTATASSTLSDNRFVVTNTLDGDRTTCWQSAGDQLESNVGVQLTYQFPEPVRIARITLVNGWARSPADFQNNQRVARASVNTDAGTTIWRVRDTAEPQTLELDPEPTSLVTLVIQEVYPGERFRDLAVTEVAFEALP